MKTRMTHAARTELVDAVRSRYSAASGKAKRRILDEFIAASGYHEKSAIRVLNETRAARERQKRRRPSLYDDASRAALIVLWEASDRVCGKRLKALLPILLTAMEKYPALLRRVNRWREDAHNRGVSVVTKTYRVFNDKWSGRKRDIFADHWTEMLECLEEHPDQTALELLVEFQVRYPGCYSQRQLHTLQKRVRVWRQQAVQRLINEVSRPPNHASIQA